jgi:hypothetical protein
MSTPWIERKPYWLKAEGVKTVEEKYGATFMGYWCIKTREGAWGESPVDVFYQPKPDLSKGHSHYFGMFVRHDQVFITNALSAFEEPITGARLPSGEVIVSRYRHDFVQKEGCFVDGGRDYFRASSPIQLVRVEVDGPDFNFVIQTKKDLVRQSASA